MEPKLLKFILPKNICFNILGYFLSVFSTLGCFVVYRAVIIFGSQFSVGILFWWLFWFFLISVWWFLLWLKGLWKRQSLDLNSFLKASTVFLRVARCSPKRVLSEQSVERHVHGWQGWGCKWVKMSSFNPGAANPFPLLVFWLI